MSKRARFYVLLAGAVVVALVVSRLSRAHDWNLLEFYAAEVVVFVVGFLPAMLWVEMAPDGALRRRPRG